MGLFGYTKQASYGYDSWAGHFWDYDIIDKTENLFGRQMTWQCPLQMI